MNSVDKSELIRYWWEKAERSLTSAEHEWQIGAYDFAVNRLYYSVFYAVSAWLIEHEHQFKKHSGARALFHREMVKLGVVDRSWAKFYDQLFEDRSDGDYMPHVTFEADYVSTQINLCRQFLQELKPHIKAIFTA